MPHCGGCASANERCGNGLEKTYPSAAVRFGRMRHIGEFSYAPDMKFTCGTSVVIATDRGIELGQQVSLTCFGCERAVSRDQMRAYAEVSGGDAYQLKKGRILREATETDLTEWRHIQAGIADKLQVARRFAQELGLDMKLIDCEHIFGGERVVFYFLAEERIDFRELVRRLAGEFQTRIEMRQIGARDEARLVADFETCGRECCCKNFLKTLKPVSMQMAKLQKATLDPSKVSGRCGRLKCCLRFEHDTYEELDARLPRLGVRVLTGVGTGQIIDRQVLTQLVKIRTDDERILTAAIEDIQQTDLPPPPPSRAAEPGEERRPVSDRDRPDNGPRRMERNGRGGSGPRQRPLRPMPSPGATPDLPPDQPEADRPDDDSVPTGPADDRLNGNPASPEPAQAGPADPIGGDRAEPTDSGPQPNRSRRHRRGRRRRHDGLGPRSSGGPGPST